LSDVLKWELTSALMVNDELYTYTKEHADNIKEEDDAVLGIRSCD
jgi:hypothetical protein